MTTNPISGNEDTQTPTTDDCYEEIASQEEIYLEKIEENLRAIAICELDEVHVIENLNEQRELAAENLVAGDSDDAPLSEEAIEGMRREI